MSGKGSFQLGKSLRSSFKIDESITYLNHGSYGCVPIPVLEAQRKLSDEIEANPAQWYFYKSRDRWDKAVERMAAFVKSDPNNLVFTTNVTNGVNAVLRSIKFNEGQTILITDHTYGPVRKTALQICSENNATMPVMKLSFPISDDEENAEFYIADVEEQYRRTFEKNPNIRVAIIDHITSASAIMLPVKKLIQVCRQHNVLVLIDGAHSPGQVQLDLENLDADFYVGSLHKWLLCPRGSALLWVNPKHHHIMRPALVSWHHNKTYQDMFFEQGTIDYSPYLCVDAALEFYEDLGGLEAVIEHNRSLVDWASQMLASEWGTEVLPLPLEMNVPFMRCVRLPNEFQAMFGLNYKAQHAIREHIYKRFKVVTVVFPVQSRLWCRVVASMYNCKQDYLLLAKAVNKLKQDIVSGVLSR